MDASYKAFHACVVEVAKPGEIWPNGANPPDPRPSIGKLPVSAPSSLGVTEELAYFASIRCQLQGISCLCGGSG